MINRKKSIESNYEDEEEEKGTIFTPYIQFMQN